MNKTKTPNITFEEIRENLNSFAAANSTDFVDFSEKILNTKKKILGVRVPDMRKIAKESAKNLSFDELIDLLENCDKNVYEEVFVCGIMISYSKLTDEEKIAATRAYLEFADSWALIDSAVMTKKATGHNDKLWTPFIEECLISPKEFAVRFAVVYMTTNFCDEENVDWVFEKLAEIRHEGYYVKMAMAWLYSVFAINFFEKTANELRNKNIDDWVKNKAYQKMLESYRIDAGKKKIIKDLKKQLKK
jgi:hypothetical protein